MIIKKEEAYKKEVRLHYNGFLHKIVLLLDSWLLAESPMFFFYSKPKTVELSTQKSSFKIRHSTTVKLNFNRQYPLTINLQRMLIIIEVNSLNGHSRFNDHMHYQTCLYRCIACTCISAYSEQSINL